MSKSKCGDVLGMCFITASQKLGAMNMIRSTTSTGSAFSRVAYSWIMCSGISVGLRSPAVCGRAFVLAVTMMITAMLTRRCVRERLLRVGQLGLEVGKPLLIDGDATLELVFDLAGEHVHLSLQDLPVGGFALVL